jgi:rubredoxin
MTNRVCPVCGFENEFEAYDAGDLASFEICPSCGTQFGYDDHASTPAERAVRHAALRTSWIAAGMRWHSVAERSPHDWDPEAQLRRVMTGNR